MKPLGIGLGPVRISRLRGRKRPKDGIKSQARRGALGRSWWAKRWIAVLKAFQTSGPAFSEGALDARSGQALSIDIEKGLILAKVQGSALVPTM